MEGGWKTRQKSPVLIGLKDCPKQWHTLPYHTLKFNKMFTGEFREFLTFTYFNTSRQVLLAYMSASSLIPPSLPHITFNH